VAGSVALGLLVAIVGFAVFSSNPIPAEDAAILFRYSENVASGYGIVFNPMGPRVDGATDMLFMLTLAALVAVGFGVEVAAAAVNSLSLGLIATLLFLAWQSKAVGPSAWAGVVPVAVVLGGPIWLYGQMGFGTPAFAAACTVVAAASISASKDAGRGHLLFLGSAVALAGLVRPEGFILGPLIVAAQAIVARSLRMLVVPAAVWLPAVIGFVGWRNIYFGYPLPNPFYKKSGGTLHLEALHSMAEFVAIACLPILALLLFGLLLGEGRRRAYALVGIAIGWTASWTLLSDEMNVWFRFQYALLPVLLTLSSDLWRAVYSGLSRLSHGAAVFGVAMTLVITSLCFATSVNSFLRPSAKMLMVHLTQPEYVRQQSVHAQVASVLRENGKGVERSLASTEAGYVAWRSGWTVTDLWGLNDKTIAHDGYLKPSQLVELAPEVIFAHIPTDNHQSSSVAVAQSYLPGWTGMTEPLLCFVNAERYVLLGQWRDGGSFVVLARRDLPDLMHLKAQFSDLTVWGVANTASDGPLPVPEAC